MSTHTCPGPDCEEQIERRKLACPPHWAQVPRELQQAVYAAYRRHGIGSGEHMNAVIAAVGEMKPLGG